MVLCGLEASTMYEQNTDKGNKNTPECDTSPRFRKHIVYAELRTRNLSKDNDNIVQIEYSKAIKIPVTLQHSNKE
jgi:hypothetical protein